MKPLYGTKDCPFCGSDHKSKCYFVYESGYHCFSCGASKTSIRNFQIKGLETSGDITLPELTRNPSMFSLPILKWLRSYHVTDDLIYKYSVAEAEDNSVITPVIKNEKVVMYQRRWFDPRRIMTYGKKQSFIATSESRTSQEIVIVEDFISAIRVGEVCDCYCMFGTSIPYEILESLIAKYAIIVVWADGDKPGQKAASKLSYLVNKLISKESRKRSFAYSFDKIVINVLTEHDPKCYTNTQVKAILTEHGVYDEKTSSQST